MRLAPGPRTRPPPLLLGFFSDGCADLREQFWVPTPGSSHLSRKAGGRAGLVDPQHIRCILLLAQTVRTIAHKKRRNAVLLVFFCLPEVCTGAKGNFVLQGHLAQDLFNLHTLTTKGIGSAFQRNSFFSGQAKGYGAVCRDRNGVSPAPPAFPPNRFLPCRRRCCSLPLHG